MNLTSIFFRKVDAKNMVEIHYTHNTEGTLFNEQITGSLLVSQNTFDGKTIKELQTLITTAQGTNRI